MVNALNYTPDGGRISVKLAREDGWVKTEVRDTGIGISAIDLAHIFEPFYRADKSRNVDTGGMGLGLAIAQRIVIAHGGRLEADSTPGEGSVFRLWLPIVRELESSIL
jgi:signal transduction histidine kinase